MLVSEDGLIAIRVENIISLRVETSPLRDRKILIAETADAKLIMADYDTFDVARGELARIAEWMCSDSKKAYKI